MKIFKLLLTLLILFSYNSVWAQTKLTSDEVRNLYEALTLENSLKTEITSKIQNQKDANILFSNVLKITDLRITSIKNFFKFYKIREPKTRNLITKTYKKETLELSYDAVLADLQKNSKFYNSSAISSKNTAVKSLFKRLHNFNEENISKLKQDWGIYSAKIPKD